jgi:hypothetical protein
MKIKILTCFLILLISSNFSYSQEENDYVILLNSDTLPIVLKKFSLSKIVAISQNGEIAKYTPEDILGYRIGGRSGSTGRVCYMIIGFKTWRFLSNIEIGAASLCSITSWEKSISGTGEYFSTSVYFYRKAGEARGKYYKFISWRKLNEYLSDCPAYVIKQNSSEPCKYLKGMFTFYNENCK